MSLNDAYWNIPYDKIFKYLNSSIEGLSEEEALNRLKIYGSNTLKAKKK